MKEQSVIIFVVFFIGGFLGYKVTQLNDRDIKETAVKEYIQHPERFGVQILYLNDIPRDTIVTYLK